MNSDATHLDKLHICFVSSQNILDYIGGVRSFTVSAIEWLGSQGVEVSLVYRDKGQARLMHYFRTTKSERSEAYSINTASNLHSNRLLMPSYLVYSIMQLFFCLSAVIGIINMNKRHTISLIHAQDTHYAALASNIVGMLLRKPVVVHAHGSMYLFNLNVMSKGIQLLVHKLALKCSNLVISVNDSTRRWLIAQFNVEQDRVITLPLGIEIGKFRPDGKDGLKSRQRARKALGIDEKTFVVGFVGRLSSEKNVQSLMVAFADFLKSIPTCKNMLLLIMGGGKEEKRLMKLSKELQMGKHVVFTGYIEDVPGTIHAIDVLVVPSFTEGSPIVILEAKASGIATIASNIPGIKEIINDGESGLLVNPNKTNEIKDALEILFKNPALRRRLADGAAHEASDYDQNKNFLSLREIYASICTAWPSKEKKKVRRR